MLLTIASTSWSLIGFLLWVIPFPGILSYSKIPVCPMTDEYVISSIVIIPPYQICKNILPYIVL